MVVDPTPNTSLGQHWLNDTNVLEDIVQEAHLQPNDNVLEIGPGPGALTKVLLDDQIVVTAVEFDVQLAKLLVKRFNSNRLKVIQQDILKFNLTSLSTDYTVVANIPYYLTSKLVRILCESANPPKTAVLLVQKEVAQRIAAKPGAMSVLSVSAQVFNTVRLGRIVQPELFTPPPKVDSQVVILERRIKPYVPKEQLFVFFQIVKAGFSERRKKLRSSLSGGLHIEKTQADQLLQKAGIAASARAQELSLDDWLALVNAYINYVKK